jgi:RHS repeat-associated protein
LTHDRSSLMEETHYYPFGMVMAGISSKAAGKLENRYKYNGKEEQRQEFADGSGLDLNDYSARMQDPQLGRMCQVDPDANNYYFETPFMYGANNPISFIDPDGRDRIRTTYTTYEMGNGESITFSRNEKVSGELQKVAIYDEDGNITGYDWHDINETQSVTYNSEGNVIGGGASYTNGAKRTHTDGSNESWAKLKVAFMGGESFRQGGGIMFTSASGQGGGPRSRYIDAQPESIDALVSALSVAGTALGQGRLESVMDKLEYVKDAINTYTSLQDVDVQPFKIDLLPANSTRCLSCDQTYHGLPAVKTGPDRSVTDTLKPNPNTGRVDTIPRVKQTKRKG